MTLPHKYTIHTTQPALVSWQATGLPYQNCLSIFEVNHRVSETSYSYYMLSGSALGSSLKF